MADRQSVFTPLTPDQLEGPFSGYLKPPEPAQQQPLPPAPLSHGGGIAMAMTSFVDAATKSRIRAYEQKENQKLQKLNQLNNYITNLMPTLTPEGQQQAQQIYFRAIGGEVTGATDQQGKSKKGKGEPTSVGEHFTSALKDIASGMTGGKTPKGAKDVDLTATIGNLALIGSDPKYSREGVLTGEEQAAQQKIKALPPGSSYEEYAAVRAPHLAAIAALSPERAANFDKIYGSAYQQASRVGSPEWRHEQNYKILGITPGSSTATPPPPEPGGGRSVTPADFPRPSNVGPPASPVPLPAGVNATGAAIPFEKMQAAEEEGFIKDKGEFETPDGVRVRGSIVGFPEGTAFVGRDGRVLDVNVNDLVPFKGRKSINIVNPKDDHDVRSVILDEGTGYKIDPKSSQLLSPDMQGWEDVTGSYRPQIHYTRGADGNWRAFDPASGTTQVIPGGSYQAPDRFLQHFNITQSIADAKGRNTAENQINSQYRSEKFRASQSWDREIAKIAADPLMKKPEKDKQTTALQKQKTDALQEVEDMKNGAMQALDEQYPKRGAAPSGGNTPAAPKLDKTAQSWFLGK